ncbi:MAG: glycosyltransferase family 39 protein [Anaerolineae bacterium]|nr:glycosyltransferase family 39 protein [Anaerolineae bacterium]
MATDFAENPLEQHPIQGSHQRWLQWGLLLVVVVLAAVLRFSYPGVNSFASDEARVSLMALDTAHGVQIATYGIASSAGARNLPASIYVFVPPFLLSSDPLVATYFVGLLNIAAIVFVYWLACRIWSVEVAFVAALYLAVSPFDVFFSRNIWTQNLLVTLSALWFVLAYRSMVSSTSRVRSASLVALTMITGVGFQIHFAAISLIFAWVYLVVRYQWWKSWLALIGGIALSVVPLLPFLYTAACCAPELVTEYLAGAGDVIVDGNRSPLLLTLRMATGSEWNYLAAGELAQTSPIMGTTGVSVILAIIALIAGAIAFLFAWHRQNRDQRIASEILLVILITPILVFTLLPFTSRLHYFLTTLPAIALIVGMSFFAIKHRIIRAGLYAVVLILAALWALQVEGSLRVINGRTAPNGLGATLQSFQAAASELADDVPLVMHTQSTDTYTRGEPAIWQVIFYERDLRLVDGWHNALLPAGPALFLADADGMPAYEEVQDYLDDAQRHQPIEGAAPVLAGTLNLDGFEDTYQWLDEPVAFSSGLTLLGWRTRTISQRYRVSTVYRIDGLPEESVINQFTHLRTADTLDPTTPPFMVADIPLTPSNWRVGDIIIGIADYLAIADIPETVTIDIGQYEIETGTRYQRTDGSGDFARISDVPHN